MLVTCKNCGKKVKLPDEVRKDARYICPGCKSVLLLTETTGDTTTSNVAPRQMHKEDSVTSGVLCPFSWIQGTEAHMDTGREAKLVWKAQSCMRSECKLWDSIQGDCGLITFDYKEVINIRGGNQYQGTVKYKRGGNKY